MLKKTNKPELEKKGDDTAEVDLEALIREHKKTEWGKQPTTFLKTLLMTPEQLDAYHKDRVRQLERLFEKYGIDPDGEHACLDLALALARRYEPGFSSRKRGRNKEHDDDVQLIFMIELLRCRNKLSIPKACEAIAEKGVIKGKPRAKTLQNRYKDLMKRDGWRVIVRGSRRDQKQPPPGLPRRSPAGFEILKAKMGEDQYIKALEEMVGGNI